jgi:hypothetical protein
VPTLDVIEGEHVERVMAAAGGHKSEASRILGVSRPRLDRLLSETRTNRDAQAVIVASHETLVLIIVIGAMVPLGTVGAWLSTNTRRSAESLLRGRLDSALSHAVTEHGTEWVAYRSVLTDIAEDSAVSRALSSRGCRALCSSTHTFAAASNGFAAADASCLSARLGPSAAMGRHDRRRGYANARRGERLVARNGCIRPRSSSIPSRHPRRAARANWFHSTRDFGLRR